MHIKCWGLSRSRPQPQAALWIGIPNLRHPLAPKALRSRVSGLKNLKNQVLGPEDLIVEVLGCVGQGVEGGQGPYESLTRMARFIAFNGWSGVEPM